MLTVKARRKAGDKRGAQPLPTNSEADNMAIRQFRIKHLKLNSNAVGQFWISKKHKHNSMGELVKYYTEAPRDNKMR